MSEIIKRVSEAILNTPNASDYAELVAKNAIRAMREPTKEMIDAFYIDHYGDAEKAWQAMIDKVLE